MIMDLTALSGFLEVRRIVFRVMIVPVLIRAAPGIEAGSRRRVDPV